MSELIEDYCEKRDKPRLSEFVSSNIKSLVLYLYNKDISDSHMIRQELSNGFMEYSNSHPNIVILNDKNSVDWLELSNKVKQFEAFSLVSENENNNFLKGAKDFINKLVDPFADDSKYISPLILKQNIKDWKAKATYVDKLHLQDLLYYHIIDLTSANKDDGTHAVFGAKLEAEIEKFKPSHKPEKNILRLTKELLGLTKPNSASPYPDYDLHERLKSAKANITTITDKEIRNNMMIIAKTCKIYVKLEKEKIRLYEAETNEATYLMCYLRPMLLEVLKPCSFLKFLWCEVSLKCKKRQENEVLLLSDGKSTTTTKIDGIIVDEEFDLEVAIVEVSGPNWKVNTTHFFEDKKKLAKNMKSMYETIIGVKDNPCLVSKKELKVYGFHVYLNTLYIYSLYQPRDGSYIFNLESELKLYNRKVSIHSLPSLLSQLWLVRDLLQKQHDQLFDYICENEPSPESSYCSSDNEGPYISPKKKQKVKTS